MITLLWNPHLRGRRLVSGKYEPQPVVESLDGTVLLRSDALGLDGRVKGEEMWIVDLATGRRILKTLEQDAARRDAESRADEEAAARQDAEARIAELEARLRKKRG